MADTVSQIEAAQAKSTLAKSLAPEDVRVGDYVTPLHETYDYPSFLWCCDAELTNRAETVPIRYVAQGSGVPLKVKAICLPFVLVTRPTGGTYALDVRCQQLAKLDAGYAKVAWQALKPKAKKSERKRKK